MIQCKGYGLYQCDQQMFSEELEIDGRELTLAPKRCAHCRRLKMAGFDNE